MFFDPDKLDAKSNYKLMTSTVVPRPIAWVVTQDAEGKPNAAPFSFFNCFSGAPPVIALGIAPYPDREKDTFGHIEARREFVVNLVSEELAEAMSLTAVDFPPGWNELETAGLETVASERIAVPRIAASPVAFECKLQQIVDIKATYHMVVGDVVAIHIADEAFTNVERLHIDTQKLNLIGRSQSPGSYIHTHDVFSMPMKSFEQWQAENK